MLPNDVEILKNMNATIGKSAKWYVRIIEPNIIYYEFKSKGETVHADEFECVLVWKDLASPTASRQQQA